MWSVFPLTQTAAGKKIILCQTGPKCGTDGLVIFDAPALELVVHLVGNLRGLSRWPHHFAGTLGLQPKKVSALLEAAEALRAAAAVCLGFAIFAVAKLVVADDLRSNGCGLALLVLSLVYSLVEAGVLLLPSTIYRSEVGPSFPDRFRLGYGRRGLDEGLAAMADHIDRRLGAAW